MSAAQGPTGDRLRRMPPMAEFRAVVQPDSVLGRYNAEHWAGKLYMRRVSPYLTRALVPTPMSANGATWTMILCGWLAVAVLVIPSAWSALAAFVLIQLQLLFDCSDGELARWRNTKGPLGIYLDRIGHYTTDPGLAVAIGVHADGGLGSIGGWTTLGLLGAVLVLLVKAENDLIHVARVLAGSERVSDDAGTAAARPGLIRTLRRLVGLVPFNRILHAIEMTGVALLAAVADVLLGSLRGMQVLTVALVAVGVVVVVGHLVVILLSRRLA